MSRQPIVTQLSFWLDAPHSAKNAVKQPTLHTFWQHPEQLPPLIAQCPTAHRYLDLLGPLHWDAFPERNLARHWRYPVIPFQALVAAELIKLNEGFTSFGQLHTFLCEHPAFKWLLGFPLPQLPQGGLNFSTTPWLPSPRHLTHMLRHLPNCALQFLLDDTVQLIRTELAAQHIAWGDCIAVDTKHIVAWVKENNPKAYVAERFNKQHQPAGDPDCRLGCKRRRNQGTPPATPTRNPLPAKTTQRGEFYWGYGSGIVIAPVPHWGEFVLTELTLPFDQGDLSYFFPLMQRTEACLGTRPRIGIFDAGFDAWYVYDYFYDAHDPSRKAIVPFSGKGGFGAKSRQFSPEGLPLCAAGLPMPVRCIFSDRTSCLVEHERAQYACPLWFPQPTKQHCPIHHNNWKRKGCTAMMPTSIGARLRYALDRQSEEYKEFYRQRTGAERINAQAVHLGIERPHLRNGQAIANQNTLIYVLINLRFLQRLRQGLGTSE